MFSSRLSFGDVNIEVVRVNVNLVGCGTACRTYGESMNSKKEETCTVWTAALFFILGI